MEKETNGYIIADREMTAANNLILGFVWAKAKALRSVGMDGLAQQLESVGEEVSDHILAAKAAMNGEINAYFQASMAEINNVIRAVNGP